MKFAFLPPGGQISILIDKDESLSAKKNNSATSFFDSYPTTPLSYWRELKR
jgi:hypothetical protein